LRRQNNHRAAGNDPEISLSDQVKKPLRIVRPYTIEGAKAAIESLPKVEKAGFSMHEQMSQLCDIA